MSRSFYLVQSITIGPDRSISVESSITVSRDQVEEMLANQCGDPDLATELVAAWEEDSGRKGDLTWSRVDKTSRGRFVTEFRVEVMVLE